MSEYIEFKLNAIALNQALKNVEYKNMHTAFSNAIKQSLELIRTEAKAQLGSKVPNLSKYGDTIEAEVALNAEEGRVKLIKDRQPNYPCKGKPYWLLHFFEKGTKIRKKKTEGYHWEASSNGIGARKHRNRGVSTGRIQPKEFLATAVQNKMSAAYQKLNELINKSIGQAFHG